jgi:hypothetical protein
MSSMTVLIWNLFVILRVKQSLADDDALKSEYPETE